jgi:sarcosine oxidase subunit alpha
MVTIRFEGRSLECRDGTSVAAALWEQGIRHLSHSPKYGRPRGLTCARGHCTACLMRVDGVPNVRVCETPVHAGMTVERQDRGAFYGKPMQAVLAAGDRLFPVGFYYKWFTRPPFVSRTFLRAIRPLTGIGRLPAATAATGHQPGAAPARDLGRRRTVVIGAGASGMAAAVRAEGPVLVLDENDEPGGLRLQALREIAGSSTVRLARFPDLDRDRENLEAAAATLATADVEVLAGGRAVAGYAPGGLLVRRGAELLTLRADEIVWAAGALDTLGLFPGNDTPGVIGPRAAYRLLLRDGLDVADRHVLLVGGGHDLWLAAGLLAVRGARVSLVVTDGGMQTEISAAVDLKWRLTTGLELAGVAPRGETGLAATFAPGHNSPGRAETHLSMDADLMIVCRRGKPAYDIAYQLGGELTLAAAAGGFVAPARSVLSGGVGLTVVGEAAGALPGSGHAGAGEEA